MPGTCNDGETVMTSQRCTEVNYLLLMTTVYIGDIDEF